MTKDLDQADLKLLTVLDLAKGPSQTENSDSNSLLMLNLNNLRDIIFVQNVNLQIVYASSSAINLFGYTVEEIKKLEMTQIMTPDSFNRAMEIYQEYYFLALKEAEIDIPLMEFEYVRKDGSTFWGELKVSFVKDSEGNIIGSQGILRDIDERKKMEQNLFQSNAKFHTLFDLSPQAIALTQIESGRIIDVNEKFCQLTKYRQSELIGKSTTELGFYSVEDRRHFISRLRESGEVRGFDMNFNTKDGSVLNAQMYAKVIEVGNQRLLLTVFYEPEVGHLRHSTLRTPRHYRA